MIELNFNDYYLISSNKEVFLFKKTVEQQVESSVLNFITEESILLYSATIDTNDNIYILVLSKSGDLNLYINKNNTWVKNTIAKFDLVANSYKQLEIKIVNEKINIFYSFFNTSFSNIWMIQHLTFKKVIEERHTIVRYAANNICGPFIIDMDSNGNIHMIYNNNSQVYYTLYNPFTKKWNTPLKQLTKQGSINISPYVFVDTKDNLHCLWVNKVKEQNLVNYMRMPIKGKDSFIWRTIKFSFFVRTEIMPIIFQEKDILKLIYYDNNTIHFLYSVDSGTTWAKGEKSIVLGPNDTVLNTPSNLMVDSKVNHLITGISELLQIEPVVENNDHIEQNLLVIEDNTISEYEPEQVVVSDFVNPQTNEFEETLQLILQNQNEIKILIEASKERELLFREELILAVKDIEIKNGFFHKVFRSLNN